MELDPRVLDVIPQIVDIILENFIITGQIEGLVKELQEDIDNLVKQKRTRKTTQERVESELINEGEGRMIA